MTILCISSQVVYGPVGNSAAVPALQHAGFTVLPLPTTMLSNHPGHGAPVGIDVPADTLSKMLKTLQSRKWLNRCISVMTGYFHDKRQVSAVSEMIAGLKKSNADLLYLCDPVLGDDHTGVYVAEPTAAAIRDQLVPQADIISPNRFELEWLTGRPVAGLESARQVANDLPCPTVVVSSLPVDAQQIATAVIGKNTMGTVTTARRNGVPHGTGDLLSGLFLAAILGGKDQFEALGASIATLEHVIGQSGDSGVLNIPRGLTGSEALAPLPVIIHSD